MTISIFGALIVAHRVLAAEVWYTLINGPGTVKIGLVVETTPLVHASSKLLNSKNSKQQEDKEHEKHGITQIRKRTEQSSDQTSHFRKRVDAL